MASEFGLEVNDEETKREKKRKDKDKKEKHREKLGIEHIMRSRDSRRFLWKILEDCSVFGSVWHSSALIHYKSGQQDVGHKIMAKLVDANENYLLTLMKESKGGHYD